jgi:hypothetical protein
VVEGGLKPDEVKNVRFNAWVQTIPFYLHRTIVITVGFYSALVIVVN